MNYQSVKDIEISITLDLCCHIKWDLKLLEFLFYPAPCSYSAAAQSGLESDVFASDLACALPPPTTSGAGRSTELCPYAAHGECMYGDQCMYRHGHICDLCGKAKLDPLDEEQRKKHTQVRVAITQVLNEPTDHMHMRGVRSFNTSESVILWIILKQFKITC